MYLIDSSAPPVNNRKWNLGRLRGMGCGCKPNMGRLGLQPVRLPNLGAWSTAQSWRGGLGRLGASSGPQIVWRDPASGWSMDAQGNQYNAQGNPVSPINTPVAVGVQNLSPVAGGASNGGITTVMATQPSKNPLDYASPQAAIAAGLPANKVMAAWSAALAKFSSPQAAISAGVPAGVVNQLWQQSNVNRANKRIKRRMGRLGRMGAAGTGPYCVYYGADGVTPESTDYNSSSDECLANGGAWVGGAATLPAASTPSNPLPLTTTKSTTPGSIQVSIAPPSPPLLAPATQQSLTNLLPWALGGFLLVTALGGHR